MILVYGTICLDRVREIEKLPGPGGYAEVRAERFMLGGEAANTALALKTWGKEVALAGNALGSGGHGELLEELILARGLSTEYLVRGEGETPVCDVYVTPDGERTMFGLGFASMGKDADPSRAPFQSDKFFTAEPNFGEIARDAARIAHSKGMKTYLLDFIKPDDPIFEGSFWQSSTDWAGKRNDVEGNLSWMRDWIKRYRATCILTDGPKGFAFGAPSKTPKWFPPFPALKVVDSTGAGDIFRAGMLLGLDENWPMADTLRFAAAAGAVSCQGLGATGYLPSREEVETHIKQNPEIARKYE